MLFQIDLVPILQSAICHLESIRRWMVSTAWWSWVITEYMQTVVAAQHGRKLFHEKHSFIKNATAKIRAAYPLNAFNSIVDEMMMMMMIITRSIWKMFGPFATASRRTPHYHSSGVATVASHAACASMSTTTTTTTTTTRDRGDRYGFMEWAQ